METLRELCQPLIDKLPEPARPYWWLVLVVVGLVILLVLWLLIAAVRRLFRRRPRPAPNQEHVLRENLAEYSPPTGNPGSRRLTVEGIPVRLRLVVVAPVGKEANVAVAEIETVLEQVVRGLGKTVQQDRPRIKVWPPQLSSQGFAAVFHRLILKPEPEGRPSRWMLLAGQAKIQQKPLLIGLALWTDQPDIFGRHTLQPDDWNRMLRYEST